MIWLYILIFIISCLVLVRSGTWVVQALTRIAKTLEWKEFVVSFILMAFATTLPELFVGITAAFHHKPELSFGNIIGSNIINLTLVVAVGVLLAKGLKCEAATIQRSSIYTAAIALLPVLLMLDGKISRVDGIVLLLALVFYFHQLALQEEAFTKIFSNRFKKGWTEFKLFLKDLAIFLAGICLLLLSAQGIVWSASFLAAAVGLPLLVIGILIVALGTNLPEIVFGVKAVLMGHKDMVLGNLIGAVVVNSTLVLGLTVLIYPLEIVKFSPYVVGIIFTVVTCLFFTIFSRTGKEITKKEAIFLVAIYVVFVVSQLLVS